MVPVIDLSECRDCDACIEVSPTVFRRNDDTGLIEVTDLPEYPEPLVEEAMAMCPEDCIAWDEIEEQMP